MASFFSKNQQAAPVSQRTLYQNKYNSARSNLMLVVLFTVINIILLVTQSNSYFLFSAFIPYIIVGEGMLFCGMYPAEFYADELAGMEFMDKSLFTVMLVIAAVIVAIYLLCWIFSKKNKVGWLVAALVLFVVDTVGMLVLSGFSSDSIIDVVFHIWVIWSLISGVIAYNKLKKLPEEEEVVVVAEEAPVIEAPENAPVEATQEPAEAEETPAEAEETPAEAEVIAAEAE